MVTRRNVVRAGVAAAALIGAPGLAVPAAHAQPPADREALRRALDDVVANGVSAALLEVTDAAGTWRGASGVAELDEPRPAPVSGRFRVGSITKTFVSTVALQLVAEGRLRLTDTVERWLPGLVPGGPAITLRHLLGHTSGLYNYTDDVLADVNVWLRQRFRTYTPRELVGIAVRHDPLFPPGTSWSYSNTNYIVAAMIIERVIRCSYASAVEQRIVRPLALAHTWAPGVIPVVPGPHAHSYVPVVRNGHEQPLDVTELNPSVAWAAGEIISTTQDLNRFYGGLLGGHLLPPAMLREMKTVGPDDYGLGLVRLPLGDSRVLWGHTGGIPNYISVAFTSEDATQRFALSITPWGPGDFGGAVNRLAAIAFGLPLGARSAPGLAIPLSRHAL